VTKTFDALDEVPVDLTAYQLIPVVTADSGASRNLGLADNGLFLHMTHAGPTLVVQNAATTAYIADSYAFIYNTNAMTLDADTSVVFNALSAGTNIAVPAGSLTFLKRSASNTWKVNYIPSPAIVVVSGGALGTPSSGTGTNLTGIPGSGLITGTLGVGFPSTEYDNGTKSSGSWKPDPALSNFQKATNNGAHTLTPPDASGDYDICIAYVNGASAGAVTTSGFTKVDGDTPDTTNAHAFNYYITKNSLGTHLTIKRMV
jgi:hypothetical protein